MSVITKDLGAATAYGYAVEKGYTGTEEEFAELMASYATVGQTAVDAKDAAVAAKTAAQTAATTATNKASEATTSAQTATTKAGEASQSASQAQASAQTASTKASEASTSASTATAKATEATTAATSANTAKTDAVAAKTAAETAQGKAETAQGAAEDAAESVSASAAQIATNTADITDLKENLNKKANADGSYDTLTAGNAKQLLSNLEQTDMVPYNYRTAGGSLEIGDREKLKKIVGGSLAVNQLVQNGNFNGSSAWYATNATLSISSNVATLTPSNTVNGANIVQSKVVEAHKYFGSAEIYNGATGTVSLQVRDGSAVRDVAKTTTAGTWVKIFGIANATSANSTGYFMILFPTVSDVSVEFKVKNVNIIDLTAMFGTTIADYVYSLESGTTGAGVEWLKSHFPRIFDSGYIPYNAGTLEHVSGLSAHKMTGFNQWDEEWEVGYYNPSNGEPVSSSNTIRGKNYIPVLPSTSYYFYAGSGGNDVFRVIFYDANKSFISSNNSSVLTNHVVTTPENCAFIKIYFGSAYGTTYKNDICINLHWDGERDGEYEPYEEHSYPLDSDVTLRGIPKLDANNDLYYDGDEYMSDGTVNRRYGIVDLGTLTWTQDSDNSSVFYTDPTYLVPKAKFHGNLFCKLYDGLNSGTWRNLANMQMVVDNSVNIPILRINNNSFSEQTGSDFKAAMSGVYLVYELATPTTESADPYTEIQNVSNWGTEEFVTNALVPVGHVTGYQPDLRAKIEVAPESPDGDGLYLMKRENGQNSYVAYLGELPTDPTTDGTYTLKATVSSGTVTKTWEADT